MNRLITITKERLSKAKTPKGGYRNSQFRALGLDTPVRKGWKEKVIGSKITLRTFIAFVKNGKNKLYLGQILDALPSLNPPLVAPLNTEIEVIEIPKVIKPKRLNAKEMKKERNFVKKESINYDREKRIREFGVNLVVALILEKEGDKIHYSAQNFLNNMLKIEDCNIPSCDIKRLYERLKKCGIVLSKRKSGFITPTVIGSKSELKKKQFLYIIREKDTDFLKIGISKDPKARKRGLQTSNPNILVVKMVFITSKNAIKLEKELHKFFIKKRKQGEWFENITDQEIIKKIGDKACLTTNY